MAPIRKTKIGLKKARRSSSSSSSSSSSVYDSSSYSSCSCCSCCSCSSSDTSSSCSDCWESDVPKTRDKKKAPKKTKVLKLPKKKGRKPYFYVSDSSNSSTCISGTCSILKRKKNKAQFKKRQEKRKTSRGQRKKT